MTKEINEDKYRHNLPFEIKYGTYMGVYKTFRPQRPFTIRVFPRIVLKRTQDEKLFRDAESLIVKANGLAVNLDLFYETNNEKYNIAAKEYREQFFSHCSTQFNSSFVDSLKNLENELLKFFPYEKELWVKIHNDQPPKDEEIEKYINMRASDAFLHAKIVEVYTKEDFSIPMFCSMRLLDTFHDIVQYQRDLEAGLPSVMYMFYSQRIREGHIPSIPEPKHVVGLARKIYAECKSFDYKNCNFLRGEINRLLYGIENFWYLTTPGR
jgi:hypothetical protein